ncbi:MAG: DUF695 domain-containing protein [Pseudomonadales bacterium]|nr:DUF695 domain-containing protein [Pseudomonadales bacterium]
MSEKTFEKVSIQIPAEDIVMVDFTQDDESGMAHINKSLKDFIKTEGKKAFPWHLSLIMTYTDQIEDKMPSKAEHKKLADFQQKVDGQLKENGNALFLASITHNGYRELIWRIHNPYPANDTVHDLIEAKDHPHPFDFKLEEDKDWQSAKWHIDALDAKKEQKNNIEGKYWE